MKKPEYIACVTNAYRRAIDGASKNELLELKKELFSVFNRGEFSTGYYFGDNGQTDCIAKAALDDRQAENILSRNPLKLFPVKMSIEAVPGKEAVLSVSSSFGDAIVKGSMVEVSNNPINSQTIDRVKQQLSKLGGTYFTVESAATDIEGFIPISSINEMRRKAVAELISLRSIRRKPALLPDNISLKTDSENSTHAISAHVFNTIQAIKAYESGANEIVLEYGQFSQDDITKLQYLRRKATLCIALPITLLKDDYDRFKKQISSSDFDAIEINNLGQLEFAKGFAHIYGGYHLNAFNAHAVNLLLSLGIERVTLSVELNPAQVREIQRAVPADAIMLHAYGRVTLMNLYHCPIKEHIGCAKCGAAWQMIYDSDGRGFPIIGTKYANPCAVTRMYNCSPHDIMPKLSKVGKINYSLIFTTEDINTVKSRIECTLLGGGDALPNTTRGYFNK